MPTVHSRFAGDLAVRASPRLQAKGDAEALRVMKHEKRMMDSSEHLRIRATNKLETQANKILQPHHDAVSMDHDMTQMGPAIYVNNSAGINNFNRMGRGDNLPAAAMNRDMSNGIDTHIRRNKIAESKPEMTTFRADERSSISPYQKDDRGTVVSDRAHLSTSVSTTFQIGAEERDKELGPRKFGEDWMLHGRSHAPMGGQGNPYERNLKQGQFGQGERLYERNTQFKVLDVEPGVHRTQVYARELTTEQMVRNHNTTRSSLSNKDQSKVLNPTTHNSDQRRMNALGVDRVRAAPSAGIKNRFTLR